MPSPSSFPSLATSPSETSPYCSVDHSNEETNPVDMCALQKHLYRLNCKSPTTPVAVQTDSSLLSSFSSLKSVETQTQTSHEDLEERGKTERNVKEEGTKKSNEPTYNPYVPTCIEYSDDSSNATHHNPRGALKAPHLTSLLIKITHIAPRVG